MSCLGILAVLDTKAVLENSIACTKIAGSGGVVGCYSGEIVFELRKVDVVKERERED